MKYFPLFLTIIGGWVVVADGAETVSSLLGKSNEASKAGRTGEAIEFVNKALATDPENSQLMYYRAQLYSRSGEHAKSIEDLSKSILANPKNPQLYQLRGLEYFKLPDIDKSILDFDQYLKMVPSQEPYHWQRGIAYYYAGRFADGQRQFELHQTVNPSDVENAVWHFACVARLKGFENARQSFIVIPDDSRVPMMAIHALFAGTGKVEDVLAVAKAGNPSSEELKNRLFYASLYLGLYFEAKGDTAQSLDYIKKAVLDYPEEHYMGDVARTHLALATKNATKSPSPKLDSDKK